MARPLIDMTKELYQEAKMTQSIFSIGFIIFLFGIVGFIIYKWTKKISQKKVADFGLKSSDKFGCH